ncbi:MAG: phosphomevalonate kinase [bacterium]
MNNIHVKAPGKLMLSGEWGILEPHNSCITLPINKFVYVTITSTEAQTIHVCAPDIGINSINLYFDGTQITSQTEQTPAQFNLTQKTIETVLLYLKEQNIPIQKFSIHINSQEMLFTCAKRKLGLGSSAAVTVALIKAILQFHKQNTESQEAKEILFKLSYLAHYRIQENIYSGYDIATSVYQKPLYYKRFDTYWLMQEHANPSNTISTLAHKIWPEFCAQTFELPENFILQACFVGYSASTPELIKHMKKFKTQNPENHKNLCQNIQNIVTQLFMALKNKNNNLILDLIKKNTHALRELAHASVSNLETPEMALLIECAQRYNAAAKLSGAGGGDCGIAICFDEQTASNIKKCWEDNELYPIEISILK